MTTSFKYIPGYSVLCAFIHFYKLLFKVIFKIYMHAIITIRYDNTQRLTASLLGIFFSVCLCECVLHVCIYSVLMWKCRWRAKVDN